MESSRADFIRRRREERRAAGVNPLIAELMYVRPAFLNAAMRGDAIGGYISQSRERGNAMNVPMDCDDEITELSPSEWVGRRGRAEEAGLTDVKATGTERRRRGHEAMTQETGTRLQTKVRAWNVLGEGSEKGRNGVGDEHIDVRVDRVDLTRKDWVKEERMDQQRHEWSANPEKPGQNWWLENKGKPSKEVIFKYPWDGKGNGAGGAVYVTAGDLERLEPGKWLSDSLVMFGIKIALAAVTKSNKRVLESVHVFSNFFYTRLKKDGYDKVKGWTKGVDIFKKEVLLMPINEGGHWFLVLIVDPWKSVQNENCDRRSKDGTIKTRGTLITTLDSIGYRHNALWDTLEQYLKDEARDKRGRQAVKPAWKGDLKVACQMNGWDCGLYVIHFTEMILCNIKYYSDMVRQVTEETEETVGPQWEIWKVERVLSLREKLIQEASSAGRAYEVWRGQQGETRDNWSDDEEVEVIAQ